MATLSFFNPETGDKVGEGDGQVHGVAIRNEFLQALEERKKLDSMFAQTEEEMQQTTRRVFKNRETYCVSGTATTHIGRKKWQRLQRTFGIKKERLPRKWKKAARRIHMEVMPMASRITNQAELIANPHADVNVEFAVDYRIKVEGRRTRLTERIAARARYLLSESHRREVERFMARFHERIKPGMLTYED